MTNYAWDLAGLSDSNGNLGKPVPSGQVLVPGTIRLVDEAIEWSLDGPSHAREVPRSLLNEFVNLWAADTKSIVGFAKKWGVLAMQPTSRHSDSRLRPCGEALAQGSDPISAWRYFSKRAFAVLNIAAALRQGKLGDVTDWGVIAALDTNSDTIKLCDQTHIYGMGWHMFAFGTDLGGTRQRGQSILAKELTLWLTFWRTRRLKGISDFAVQWNATSGRLELKVDYNGYLFAALALQLALTLVGSDNLYTCSGCAVPYVREMKRPKAGWGNYCPTCSLNGVAQKRAAEAYRERKAEAKDLAADGLGPEDIAKRLGLSVSRVSKWTVQKSEASASRHQKGKNT